MATIFATSVLVLCNFRFGPFRAIPFLELQVRRCVQFFQFICVWRNSFSTYTDITGFIVIRVKFVLNLELTR